MEAGERDQFPAKERLVQSQEVGVCRPPPNTTVVPLEVHWKGHGFEKGGKGPMTRCVGEPLERKGGRQRHLPRQAHSQPVRALWQLPLSTPASVLIGQCPWHTSRSCLQASRSVTQPWCHSEEGGLGGSPGSPRVFVSMYCHPKSRGISGFALSYFPLLIEIWWDIPPHPRWVSMFFGRITHF